MGEQVIGQLAGLFKAIDTFGDFKVDIVFTFKVMEAIFQDEFMRNVGELNAGVFGSVQWGSKVKVGNVKRSKLCRGCGYDAV